MYIALIITKLYLLQNLQYVIWTERFDNMLDMVCTANAPTALKLA